MIFGAALASLTGFHVVLSLIALVLGALILPGFLSGRLNPSLVLAYLAMSFATSLTGFMLPADRFLPSHLFGILSLLALGAAAVGHYLRPGLAGRIVFVSGSIFAFYLNAFVFVVQSFLKFGELHALAPTGTEPPFAIAQGVLFIAFATLTGFAIRNTRRRN